MTFSRFVFAAVVLISTVAAGQLFSDDSPAIDWTWDSYITGGPICHDVVLKHKIVGLSDQQKQILTGLMDNFLADFESQTPSLATGVSVVFNDEVLYSKSAGVVAANSTTKPDENTVFGVGSLTKMFTTLMMNMLAEKGALDPTDPVRKYFNVQTTPEFKPINPYEPAVGADAVTLESLAGQVSGLPRGPACVGEGCDMDSFMAMVNAVPLLSRPMTKPHYSNTGFTILGRCLERAAQNADGNDKTYEEWLKENVFDPLEMSSTGFDFPDDVRDRMAIGYSSSTAEQVSSSFARSLGVANPAGGMYSTLKDVNNFMVHLLKRDKLLSPNGFEEFYLPGVLMADGISSYGKNGWEVAYANGFRVLTKSGSAGGFSVYIAIVPELMIGVFNWINYDGAAEPGVATATLMNKLIPTIVSNAEKDENKREVPAFIDELLGQYIGSSPTEILVMKPTKDSDKTGVYTGIIETYPMWFEYDARTTEAVGDENLAYFRFFLSDPQACFATVFSSMDNGLVEFKKNGGNWTVFIPDEKWGDLQHTDAPVSYSSSTSSSDSSLSSSSNSSVGSLSSSVSASWTLTASTALLALACLLCFFSH